MTKKQYYKEIVKRKAKAFLWFFVKYILKEKWILKRVWWDKWGYWEKL